MSKSGIIITLIGIGLFLISIFASEGYDQRRSIMGNMYSMEVVIDGGRLAYDESQIVGRKSIPLSFLLSLSTIITLVGIGKIILSKKQK